MSPSSRTLALLKRITIATLPPVCVHLARSVLRAARSDRIASSLPEWEYVPEGWPRQATDRAIRGWNVREIAEVMRSNWDAFARAVGGTGPLGVTPTVRGSYDHLLVHNWTMSYGYVLALAARGKQALSILDWGGGVGSYYLLTKALVADLPVDYHVKDVPELCRCGRDLLPDVTFHESAVCLERTYDLVFASSSLRYAEDWRSTLQALGQAAGEYLYVTRLPVVHTARSFVVLQRPYRTGYNTEYLGWCLNRGEFLAYATSIALILVREFLTSWSEVIPKAPEPVESRGFLFQRQRSPQPHRASG